MRKPHLPIALALALVVASAACSGANDITAPTHTPAFSETEDQGGHTTGTGSLSDGGFGLGTGHRSGDGAASGGQVIGSGERTDEGSPPPCSETSFGGFGIGSGNFTGCP